MKRIFFSSLLWAITCFIFSQSLIIRGDDIGATHASNVGVIRSYTNGIMRSAELMVVTPWLPEAVKMILQHPKMDVGIHIALTSEWENMKWRPLTQATTLTDENGYFLPCTFPNPDYPGLSIKERISCIDMKELEAELRAQIELGKKLIPYVSHLSGHMMWAALNPEFGELIDRLSIEYELPFIDSMNERVKQLKLNYLSIPWGISATDRKKFFIEALQKLEEGKIYHFIEHPAVGSEEMEAIGHIGYENVSEDRQAVLDLYTDTEIIQLLKEKNIQLLSYKHIIDNNLK